MSYKIIYIFVLSRCNILFGIQKRKVIKMTS